MTWRLIAVLVYSASSAWCGAAIAEQTDASLEVRPARDTVAVAELLAIEMVVTTTSEALVEFPSLGEKLGPFEVVSSERMPDLPVGPNRQFIFRITVESIRPGRWEIPALSVGCQIDGETRILGSDPITIEVTSSLRESDRPEVPRDSKGLIDAGVEPSPVSWWPFVVGSALAVLGAVATLLVLTRRRSVSPQAWAHDRLTQLNQSSQVLTAEDRYGQISVILRDYVQSVSGLPAASYTTEELLHAFAVDAAAVTGHDAKTGNVVAPC